MHLRFLSPLKADQEMIVKGFRAAGISEVIENAQDITEKVENFFKELYLFLAL